MHFFSLNSENGRRFLLSADKRLEIHLSLAAATHYKKLQKKPQQEQNMARAGNNDLSG